MAESVAASELITRARELADMESSVFWTDTRLLVRANIHLAWFFDELVRAAPPDYYATDGTLTVVAGTIAYNLPSDFRSPIALLAHDSATRRREIDEVPEGCLALYDAPAVSCTVTLRYVPTPPTFATSASTVDGVSGWGDIVARLMTIDMLLKEDSPVQDHKDIVAAFFERIRQGAPRRAHGGPRYIHDVEASGERGWRRTSTSVDGWRLKNSTTIELYSFDQAP